jgi:histidine triad (HIT) family protein
LSCPFCDYQGPSPFLAGGLDHYVIEPLNPVVPGHLLVIPYIHVPHFGFSQPVDAMIMRAASNIVMLKRDECDWNVITSVGPNATQTVEHLHVHLVPRREGDGLLLPWSDGDRSNST